MTTSHKPAFIVLEGLDGVGTTTHARRLAGTYTARDLRVCLTAEPSKGPIGELIRTHVRGEIELDPASAALAFCADRSDHLAREVRPALASGVSVICDRYLLSTLAYQGSGGVDPNWILSISRDADVPDITIYLDLQESERRERLSGRAGSDRYDGVEMSEPLREHYAASIELLRGVGHRIEVVEASGSVEEVADRIGRLLMRPEFALQ